MKVKTSYELREDELNLIRYIYISDLANYVGIKTKSMIARLKKCNILKTHNKVHVHALESIILSNVLQKKNHE